MYSINFPQSITHKTFLKNYWQQKSLLMPNAFQNFENPISPEELAGLALEGDFPSRIIIQHSKTQWSVEHGPFSEQTFADLDGKTWSLLITDIEKHLPDFMDYVQAFRFIPDWRFDDLMISYAPKGGSVGPHIDDYDTFLLQTSGQREWAIENFSRDPADSSDVIEGIDLRLIKNYQPYKKIVCQPGDILYMPPRYGHHGVSQSDDCMTWSMGFKAPNYHNLLVDYLEYFQQQNIHKRYTDIGLEKPSHPAELSFEQAKQIKKWMIAQLSEDDETFAKWFGKYTTQNNNEKTAVSIDPLVSQKITIEPNLFYKMHFMTIKNKTLLFAGGEEYEISLDLAKQLTQKSVVTINLINDKDINTVIKLLKVGIIFVVS